MTDLKKLKDDELCALLEGKGSPEGPILMELISRPLEKDILLYLIEYLEHFAPSSRIYWVAWDKYRKQGLNNFELRCVITDPFTLQALRDEAIVLLCCRQQLETEDYRIIIDYSTSNRAEAKAKLKDLRKKKLLNLKAV